MHPVGTAVPDSIKERPHISGDNHEHEDEHSSPPAKGDGECSSPAYDECSLDPESDSAALSRIELDADPSDDDPALEQNHRRRRNESRPPSLGAGFLMDGIRLLDDEFGPGSHTAEY